ncbi:MAG: cobyrinate a,c-diamide synthase [Candidatus Binataceae bacterium]
MEIPRIVVAASASGVGKTTVTVGLVAALRGRGLKVAVFKCGPDYLDPSYHARAAGRPSQNLDGWMMGREAVITTFASAARGADIAVIEGMMGLFDGAAPTSDEGSTAEIAKWLGAPVLLVIDASGIARTVAAIALGFARFDSTLNLAGLVCNRVGSLGHLELLRASSPGIAIVGGLPSNSETAFPERHLGLFTADEKTVPDATIGALGGAVAQWCDLDRIIEIARGAPPLEAGASADSSARRTDGPRCRIGVALDDAFHFYYEDNLRRMERLGVEIVNFAPSRDSMLPAVDGLYFGGGYPEAVAGELSSNAVMLDAIRSFAARGGPIYAECGGLMYLSRGIRTLDGRLWPMAGLIAGEAVMHDRLQALGYVEVETRAASILGPAGQRFRGHQFRYSTLEPAPANVEQIYSVKPRWGADFAEGYRTGNVLASYVHAHWASNPAVAEALVSACVGRRADNARGDRA